MQFSQCSNVVSRSQTAFLGKAVWLRETSSNEPLQYQDSYVVIHCLKCPAGIVKGRRRLWARSRNSLVAILPRLLTLPWLKWVREGEMWSFLLHVDVADIVWDVDWTVQTTVIEVRCTLNWSMDRAPNTGKFDHPLLTLYLWWLTIMQSFMI